LTLAEFNALAPEAARAELLKCCHAARWADGMLERSPFATADDVYQAAAAVWSDLGDRDFLEAFEGHPRIGDIESLRKKFASTAAWAAGEQAGTSAAAEDTLAGLAEGNRLYEARFGHIFIVCATGKSAGEMLAILQDRLPNEPAAELRVAAAEQAKITRIRLEKLLTS
jgi:2-oxo-4-hydroxy-4-carboxy-5-ureidoimidazoline decarboxylase